MSEDTENNIVNLSEYRERREQEEAAKKEQEDFFNDDYPNIYPEGKTTHIKVDGSVFSIEDIMTPEQSKDMVNTIMHLIRLMDEKDRLAAETENIIDDNPEDTKEKE
jgi:hypothetical protein